MPALKLSMAATVCGVKPYKWVRTVSTTTTSASATSTAFTPSSPLLPLSNTNWRRIAPCAHFPFHTNHSISFSFNSFTPNNWLLGFPRHKFKSFSLSSSSSSPFSSSPSSSSPHKSGGFSGSDSSPAGSGLLSDMGSENKVDGVDWFHNHALNAAPIQPTSSAQNHPHQHHHQPSKLLTLPTILTLGRVAAVPLLICTFYVDSWLGRTATTSIFIAAAITDWLDGYLARKMRLGSAFGAFLDPVADKLMVAATLVLLCSRPFEVAMFGQVPWLLTVPSIAIIGREITMSAVREWAAAQNSKLLEAVAVNNLGKWKTATQMIALTILLATRDSSVGGTGILVASGVALLYISAGLSVWSLAVYMSKIWRVLLK